MSYRCSCQRWSMISSSRERSSARISSSPSSCSRASYWASASSCSRAISSSRSTRVGVERGQLVAGREDLLDPAHQPVDVPVLDEVAGGVLVDQAIDQVDDLLARGGGHVAPLEHLVAVGVDHLALLVEHVVVLQRVLAHQEVLLLDLLLRLLDLLGEHPGLDRLLVALVVGGAEAVEDLVDPLAGEQAHEVVLGGQEEARLSPGSPWRPERPRSWLSIRRDSWRSVPMMNRPPASSTCSRSPSMRRSISGSTLA